MSTGNTDFRVKESHHLLKLIVALVFASVVIFTGIHLAKNKLFWNDEGFDVINLCSDSLTKILKGKTGVTEQNYLGEANKSPLYYIFERISILKTNMFSTDILVNYRLVSIFSAVFLVILFYFFITKRLGLFWAVFLVISIISQRLFYFYAAESRPYMMWLMTFTCLVITTSILCVKNWDNVTCREKLLFGLACLLNTLVTSMGIVQCALSTALCVFLWYSAQRGPKDVKPIISFVLPLMGICGFLAVYYARQGIHPYEKTSMGSPFDLLWTLQQGDFSLLKMPPRLLLPKFGRDAYLGVSLMNVFVLTGFITPAWYWNRRKELTQSEQLIFVFNCVAVVQVLATIPIATIIAVYHYWFVQRIFIYLIICHAMLAMVGGFVLFNYFERAGLKNARNIVLIAKIFLLLIVCFLSVQWHFHWKFYKYQADANPYVSENCPSLSTLKRDSLSFGEIGLLDPNIESYPLEVRIEQSGFQRPLNDFVMITKRLKECGIKDYVNGRDLYIAHSGGKGWHLTTQLKEETEYFHFCNQLVKFRLDNI